MIRVLCVISLLLVTVDSAFALTCSVPLIRTLAGQTVEGYMTVKSGRRCSINLRTSRGPTYSAAIVAQPAHGGAHVETANRVVYQSRPGYIGSDSFTYVRSGLDTVNTAITRTVRVDVTVTP